MIFGEKLALAGVVPEGGFVLRQQIGDPPLRHTKGIRRAWFILLYEHTISVESDTQAKRIKEIMESAVDLEIPNKVDYESGKNWGDIH